MTRVIYYIGYGACILRSRTLWLVLGVLLMHLMSGITDARAMTMAEGRWARISVGESGLYVLSASELKELGFERIDKVRIWGFGGALLPEAIVLTAGRPMTEVPTILEGDRLYFYGMGTTQWQYDAQRGLYTHTTNHYARRGYYLISEGDSPLRMASLGALPLEHPATGADTYIATLLHEEDTYSLSGSGRRLYGESFQTTSRRSYTHRVSGALRARAALAMMAYPRQTDAVLTLSLGANAHTSARVGLSEMNRLANGGAYHVYGMHAQGCASSWQTLDGDQIDVQLGINTSSMVSHLDYYELNVEAKLRYSGSGQMHFSRPAPLGSSYTEYVLAGARDRLLLRVDDSNTATRIDLSRATQLEDALSMRLPAHSPSGAPSRYLVLSPSDAMRPRLEGQVGNRYIRTQTSAPDLLVITTEALRAESMRLARHYEAQGMVVLVVSQQEIFDEFNGGTPDATAYRLAVRHLTDLYKVTRGTTDVDMQLLLIGDAAYDNRKLTSDWQSPALQSTEFLLSYQSVNSLDLSSYSSDDYFAVVSDEPRRTPTPRQTMYPQLHELPMDIGVGRLPVRTATEARAVIDKIIAYEGGADRGVWRMRATFVADNGDSNSHTRQSIEISNVLESAHPVLRLSKIYLSAYPRQSVGGQVTVPGAKRALMEALDRGVLLVNYNGHGSPRSWTDEQVLTQSDVQGFAYKHLPLWITATCDFSYFDGVASSAGEDILLHPTSGGIALLSTTRVVYDLPNVQLNKAVLRELFAPDAEGRPRPLGRVIRDAKNALRTMSSPENRLNFILLGSPLTRIALPPTDAVVSKVADQETDATTQPIALSALDKVRLEGYIRRGDGSIDGDFNGTAQITIYDGEQQLTTIDNFARNGNPVPPVAYRVYANVIYTGTTTVSNGYYSTEFIVPKDVAYSGEPGLISLYALEAGRTREVVGYSRQIRISSGSSSNASEDTEAPQVLTLTLSGVAVEGRPRVPATSMLYARLRDESAINLSAAGVGHRITLEIDGRTDMTYDLSQYYEPLEGVATEGTLRFAMPELPTGEHSARLTVWDVYNNASIVPFSFIVQSDLMPELDTPLITSGGELRVAYRRAGLVQTASLEVFDLSGRLVVVAPEERLSTSGSGILSLPLNTLAGGLPPAVYIVRVGLGGSSGSKRYSAVRWQVQ